MTLDIGQAAPDFSLPATNGQTIALRDLRGKIVVLYFYPKDDTPGCTTEACEFRENFNRLERQGITVLGVSKDSVKSHEKFKEKYQLNFPLLSDMQADTIKAYEAWGDKKFMGKTYQGIKRTTFLIDENGRIARIWQDVKVSGHVDEVVEAAMALKEKALA